MAALGVSFVQDLTAPALAHYRAGLVARLDVEGAGRLAPASVSLKLAALRSFLHFCRLTGLLTLPKDVLAFTLKSPRGETVRPYQVLSAEERGRMLAAALMHGHRDHALAMLALGAGLRVSELVGVRLADLYRDDEGAWWVRVVQGKGRKDRLVPLAGQVMAAVQGWLKASGRSLRRKADLDAFLFSTRKSERMTPTRAWQIVKALVREAGVEKAISPHSLRHTFALETLRRGASPVVVQRLLGHASLQTTQRYVDHLQDAELRVWAFAPACR
jgi:integrase/recombinase XerD